MYFAIFTFQTCFTFILTEACIEYVLNNAVTVVRLFFKNTYTYVYIYMSDLIY